MYKIFVKNLKLFGYHGVNPEEKINGQDFIFNVSLHLKENCKIPDIAVNDNISDTVNYSEIVKIIKKVNCAKKFDLLETLSRQIAQKILEFSPLIFKVKVKVEKPNPPIKEDLESVGVVCRLEKHAHEQLKEAIPLSQFYLSAGSNIGDREKNLRDAVSNLAGKGFIRILKVSSIYETEPMYYKEQDSFLNIALEGTISGDYGPFEFLGLLKSMEYYMGRKGTVVRHGPRLIDLDLLYFGEIKIMSDILVVPHPLIKERRFVLLPLAEIAPGMEIEGKKIADFLKICNLDEKVIKVKNW
jgi:dihydroneopterin aldolase/2-amino-4-hydroxy-6-hydroxymethyldihydropteridine diphosphokinase